MRETLTREGFTRRIPLWRPSEEARGASQLTAFMRFCETETGLVFEGHPGFEVFAVRAYRDFWQLFTRWSGLLHEGALEPACLGDVCEHATFFPSVRLSYVANLLRVDGAIGPAHPALVSRSISGHVERLTRGELRERVLRVCRGLASLGLRAEQSAVAILHNDGAAVVTALAVTGLGAVLSTSSPEMGAFSILARFGALDPAVLVCPLGDPTLTPKLAEVIAGLPTLRHLVAVDDGPIPAGLRIPVTRLADLVRSEPREGFPLFPFNHPLFTLFSSGTTGKPKCIIHGAGGTLLEHLKEHRLHGDLRPSDTLFFQTSCSWMMWNWQLSALATGARIVVSAQPVQGPETLWNIAREEDVTVFGTSPAYLQMGEDAKHHPSRGALRAVLSTGSVLHAAQFDWLSQELGDLPVQSISGGTDILGCFVLGNPNTPVYCGESQCRSLALDVQAEHGELICRNPFPSRPLGFHGDPSRERFHDAYFSQSPGVWSHGDRIELLPEGTARILGRSDGVLNVRGIRIGPAEFSRILEDMPEIAQVVPVEQLDADPRLGSRLVLLVQLKGGSRWTPELRRQIRDALRVRGSVAHVPQLLVPVDEFPHTHSGKRSDRAVREVLGGRVPENLDALRNPLSLDAILRAVEAEDARRQAPAGAGEGGTLEERLAGIWQRLLEVPSVQGGDSFFALGGTSLLALEMIAALREQTGLEVPPSSLFDAPTLGGFAALVSARAGAPLPLLTTLRSGESPPVFFVHGLAGEILELRTLAERLPGTRLLRGFRARGLDPTQPPDLTVRAMAERYVGALLEEQPQGPYALVGYSFGGLVAYEMAGLLRAAGQAVELLALIDTDLHSDRLPLPARYVFRVLKRVHAGLRRVARRHRFLARAAELPLTHLERALGATSREPTIRPWTREQMTPPMVKLEALAWKAFRAYRPGAAPEPMVFLQASDRAPMFCNPVPLWQKLTGGRVRVVTLPGDHFTVIRERGVAELAAALGAAFARGMH